MADIFSSDSDSDHDNESSPRNYISVEYMRQMDAFLQDRFSSSLKSPARRDRRRTLFLQGEGPTDKRLVERLRYRREERVRFYLVAGVNHVETFQVPGAFVKYQGRQVYKCLSDISWGTPL